MARELIVAANWKMNMSPKGANSFFEDFLPLITEEQEIHFVFFPPNVAMETTAELTQGTKLHWGPQNIHFETTGAFTGETSPLVVAEMGARYALIGHSERRTLFFESNEVIAKKVLSAIENKLIPMICVGENLSEREGGETQSVIIEQLREAFKLVTSLEGVEFVIAYEPVWAIGTGKVATPEMANEVHKAIRSELNVLSEGLGHRTSVLYGGSVKPENAAGLMAEDDIDGFLVGGASLKPDSLFGILNSSLES